MNGVSKRIKNVYLGRLIHFIVIATHTLVTSLWAPTQMNGYDLFTVLYISTGRKIVYRIVTTINMDTWVTLYSFAQSFMVFQQAPTVMTSCIQKYFLFKFQSGHSVKGYVHTVSFSSVFIPNYFKKPTTY